MFDKMRFVMYFLSYKESFLLRFDEDIFVEYNKDSDKRLVTKDIKN